MVIRFGVESLSGLLWNPYPLSRGITHRFGVEYTSDHVNYSKLLIKGQELTAYIAPILHFLGAKRALFEIIDGEGYFLYSPFWGISTKRAI